MAEERPESRTETLRNKFFYVGAIIVISFSIVALAWLFQGTGWSLLLFICAWVLVVTAFAWEIVTRAERLDSIIHSRTDALEETNRYLARLLELSRAFRRISYEINLRMELEEIAEAFAQQLPQVFSEVDGVWLWGDRRLLEGARQDGDAGREEPLNLISQAGPPLGAPESLRRIRRDNPLIERCFEDRSVAVEHELGSKGRTWGWSWLSESGMESFAGFRLQLGGEILGVLGVFSRQTISADFVRQLHLSVNQLAVAIERGRLVREMRRRADELAAAYEELQQLDAMKDWFICSVSHELRTPLTSIISFSEILEQYEDLEPGEHRQFAGIIRQESERLALLIDDMLDLSRIARGELNLEPEPFDMVGVVERCCRLFREQAERREMRFRAELPERAMALADPNATARVLNNLVDNAFKFTPDGGTVEVTVRAEDDAIVALVRDSGVGIPQEDQARIYEKFTQLDPELTNKPVGSPGTELEFAL